ncbi:MAG: crossover junction endodeoxyribonuclease RuvC [Candidatus Omnitrophica bacterium]|nr:crossover junction endodeoxyribonuclease RuvC [Candidatus Omnitrophota bacterium]
MKIMGIDPGLKATGYGVVESGVSGRPRPLEVGSIEPKARAAFSEKLLKIHALVGEIIQRQKPDVVVLEKLYSHSAHPMTASIMGHARGVIYLACAQHNVPVMEESPKRIRKAVVGNGNASKEQTRRVVAGILKVDPLKLTLDASDALALALGYSSMKRVDLMAGK